MIKFISYDGDFPNLCSGKLTLEIDGEICTFSGFKYFGESQYDSFWVSGGCVWFDDNWDENVEYGPWEYSGFITKEEHDKFDKYADELMKVFNENVPYGCCGGCI